MGAEDRSLTFSCNLFLCFLKPKLRSTSRLNRSPRKGETLITSGRYYLALHHLMFHLSRSIVFRRDVERNLGFNGWNNEKRATLVRV